MLGMRDRTKAKNKQLRFFGRLNRQEDNWLFLITIGALLSRIGFWAAIYYNYKAHLRATGSKARAL